MQLPAADRTRLREVIFVFLTLGLIGFGGPAAHIALMREELVRRRGWLDDKRFMDLMGATNLIPGPNSTELAIYLGYERAKWRGLIMAGVCFILPAVAIVLAIAWFYVRYGTTPTFSRLLYGVRPVVLAIIVMALVALLRTVVKSPLIAVVAAVVLGGYVLGMDALFLLLLGGAATTLVRLGREMLEGRRHGLPLLALPLFADPNTTQLGRLFLTFLKVGAVLYGSGYVLLAFLEEDFVDRLGWLTQDQLLDAISIGQVTPGPLFSTATFVGYVVAGLPGAVVATIGIFLPSFVLVGLLIRLVDKMRERAWSRAFLDGVNAASVALMAGVTVVLARDAVVDMLTAGLALATVLILWRTRINSAWLIAGGALVGVVAG
jgi:chromate transporter